MTPKIAYVDDEPTMHEMIQTILTGPAQQEVVNLFGANTDAAPPGESGNRTRYDIEHFEHAKDARDAIADAHRSQHPFALLVSDIRMPEFDGSWLIKQARSIDARIRVIVYTSYSDATLESLTDVAGDKNFIYLEKTVSPAVVRQAIDSELATWMQLYHDRRNANRRDADREIEIRHPVAMRGHMVDIADGGIGIVELPASLTVGEEIKLKVFQVERTLQGVVRWVAKNDDTYNAGISVEVEQIENLEISLRNAI